MRYILISLLAISPILQPNVSYANFSGLSMTESPVESVETIVDQLLKDSKLEEKMSYDPLDLKKMRSALIKGSLKDKDVLRSLVRLRNEIVPAIKDLPEEEQSREYAISQEYIKSSAEEFGYVDPVVTIIH